jgi:glycosyltransferase involved in cell wall biosynthesis
LTDGEPKPRTLLHVFSTMDVGGAQVRFAKLANRFDTPFRHLLFAMDGSYDSVELLSPIVDREICDIHHVKGQTIANVRRFRRALNALNPDVLVTYNWGAIEWALANIGHARPHIHIVDGFGPEEADRQLPRRVLFRRLALRFNTTTVVPSQTLYNIVTRIWRLKPKTVRYIPNGIDCTRFGLERDPALARRFGLGEGDIVIATVATLRPEKNLRRLIDAFTSALAAHPTLRLMIVGDGPERPGLEAHAAQRSVADRVVFAGYIADPAPVLALADIFALSSDTEQMPISVLEAMATRLPVAAVDVGDVRNIVAEANRPFIVERSADALAIVLARFADDTALRTAIGDANRQHVEAVYAETDMITAYQQLFLAG